jgi:hypothetical protein
MRSALGDGASGAVGRSVIAAFVPVIPVGFLRIGKALRRRRPASRIDNFSATAGLELENRQN